MIERAGLAGAPGIGLGVTEKVAPPSGSPCASVLTMLMTPQVLRSIGKEGALSLSCELLMSPPARERMFPAAKPGQAGSIPSAWRSMDISAKSNVAIGFVSPAPVKPVTSTKFVAEWTALDTCAFDFSVKVATSPVGNDWTAVTWKMRISGSEPPLANSSEMSRSPISRSATSGPPPKLRKGLRLSSKSIVVSPPPVVWKRSAPAKKKALDPTNLA